VPFVLDDVSITENQVIRSLSNFLINRKDYDYLPNRFVAYLTFALNYHFGAFNVVGYHAVNLLIHIMNALLVYALVRLTLRTPLISSRFKVQGSKFEVQGSSLNIHHSTFNIQHFLPFLVALLFISHPVQTQAVTYIVQRLTSLATLFYLASLVLHVRWRLAREAGAVFGSRSVLPYYLLSLLMAVLAMKTKEIAFTLPVVVLLYEFSFFGVPDRRKMVLFAPLLLTICIIPLGMISLQQSAGDILSEISTATKDAQHLSRSEYLLTQFSVIVTYLRLLILPVNQNLDYDYPLSRSLLEPRAFLSLSLLMSLFGFAVYLYYHSSLQSPKVSRSPVPCPQSPLFRLAAFGIFWFFITLAVESSIIPIRDVIFEHRVYLPSVGFFFAVAALVTVAAGRLRIDTQKACALTVLLTTAAVMALSLATYARNMVWQSGPDLWLDVKKKSPEKDRAYNNLGAYYLLQGRIPDAIRELETASRLNPQALDVHQNLGQAYSRMGRYADAIRAYTAARKIEPNDPEARDALPELERLMNAQQSGR
jgi:hypothetical protein